MGLLLLGADAAEAQTARILVSNVEQTGDDSAETLSNDHAQLFHTAGATNGYVLTSVIVVSEDAEADDFNIEICEADNTTEFPTSTCTELARPGSFAAGSLEFTHTGIHLNANDNYVVVIKQIGGGNVKLDSTTSGGEDPTGITGWSIKDKFDWKPSGAWQQKSGGDEAIQITVNGYETPPNQVATGRPVVLASAEGAPILFAATSDIADGNGLPYTGSTGNVIEFTYSYQWIRVDGDTSTETDIGVDSPRYLLVDADIGNLIKVQVSFTDRASYSETVTSRPFRPVAEPADPSLPATTLVSNTGQSASATANITQQYAMEFTLGSHGQGYEISSVSIELAAVPTDLTVSLWIGDHSSESASPYTKLFDFENPSPFVVGMNKFTALAGVLAYPSVYYSIVLSDFGSSLSIKETTSDAEDAGGETGATLADTAGGDSNVLRLAVEGSRRARGILVSTYAQLAEGDQEIISLGDDCCFRMGVGAADRYLIRGFSWRSDDTTDRHGGISNPWHLREGTSASGAKQFRLIKTRDVAGINEFTAPQGATVVGGSSKTYTFHQNLKTYLDHLGEGTRLGAVLTRIFATSSTGYDAPTAPGVTLSQHGDIAAGANPLLAVLGEPLDAMVQNLGRTDNGYVNLGFGSNKALSQGFTTGSNAGGYELQGIGINIEGSGSSFPDGPTSVSVAVHADSSGQPGAKLFDLVSPTEFAAGHSFFEAPPGTLLTPNTSYVLFWRYIDGTWSRLQKTSSDGEDSGALTGFSIANVFYRGADLNNLSANSDSNALEIAVYGEEATTPTVTAVALTSDPGLYSIYGIGNSVAATVTFSEAVDITGAPQLELDFAGAPKTANCAAATNTTTMVCSRTVAENDFAPNGIAIAANKLTFNGGAITLNGAARTAVLTHSAVAIDPGHKVDGVRPTLVTTGNDAPQTSTDGTQVIYTFSEDIGSVTINSFNLEVDNGPNQQAGATATISGRTVTVTLLPALTIQYGQAVKITLGAGSVRDAAGNNNPSVQRQAVTNKVPQPPASIDMVEITSDPGMDQIYATGDDIEVTATFDQAVAVTGKPRILLLLGGGGRGERWAEYASGSATTALVFSYPVLATDESDTDGIEVGKPSLLTEAVDLNGGTITVTATGEDASLSYAPLVSDSGHRVNWARPTLTDAVTSTDGTKVLLTFSEDLTPGGRNLNLFTVKVGGTAVTLSGTVATVSGRVVTLTLATALTSATQAVTVSYAKATIGTSGVQDLAGNDADSFTDQTVTNRFRTVDTPTEVPSNWALIPDGLEIGDKFRVLFLTSTTRDATSTDIADYNTFVQARAAAGHAAIQDYSEGFRAVASTGAVDARDNTATTSSGSDFGVPIYWLGGNKIDDTYPHFYDGTWDDETNVTDESGSAYSGLGTPQYVWTGSADNGTETTDSGQSTVLGTSGSLGAELGGINNPTTGSVVPNPIYGANQEGTSSTYPLYALSPVFVVVDNTEVPSNWALKPTGLTSGDRFRILFLSSTTRDATSTDIADYNTFVQTAAAAGHAAIQDYSDGFRAVASTVADDARDNTYTTHTASEKGLPIYWLGGNNIADEYEDFYDGSWDDEANATDESGSARSTSANADKPWTGSKHDGTEEIVNTISNALGGAGNTFAIIGNLNDSTLPSNGPLSGPGNSVKSGLRPLYGLSQIFVVGAQAAVIATTPTVTGVEITSSSHNGFNINGETIRVGVTFSAAVDITGSPELELDFAGAPKAATCTAATNTTTMACRYTVGENDSAPNGIAIAANKLTLNGGTITATGSTTINANLDHGAVAIDADQKVDGIRPTLVTTGANAPTTSADGTKVILTFSEDIGSVTPSLITIEGNSVALPTSGDNIVGPTVELTLTTALTDSAASLTVALAVGAVTDAVSNDNLAVPATTVINAVATTPMVTGVEITSSSIDATNGIGDAIEATVTFSAAVDITGTPQLELDFAGTPKAANCTAATNTTTMACRYTVAVNDSAPNGIAIAANKLTLNGGTITATGSTTLNADLDHGTKVILTFSEDIGSVTPSLITIEGNSVALPTSGDNIVGPTVELTLTTALTDSAASLTVALAVGAVTDAVSNDNLAVPATSVINALVAPNVPQSLSATPGNRQVMLGWVQPSGGAEVTHYEYEQDGSGTWTSTGGKAPSYTVTGLTNGQTYTFRVRAVNSAGASAASGSRTATPTTTEPEAPTGLSATVSDQEVDLIWTAPASNGGATILRYEYELDLSGTWTSTGGTTTSYTVPGLTNGQSYAFRVRAVNRVGAGLASSSQSATPTSTVVAPDTPSSLSATPGNRQVMLSWVQPSGGAALTHYEYEQDGSGTWTSTGGKAPSYTVTGLTNGQTYTFRVRAVNSAGPSAASGSRTATPTTTEPEAPESLSFTPGDQQVTLRWRAPTNDGGEPITHYEYEQDGSGTWISTGGTATSHTVRGLNNGQTYTFRVRAVNALGNGAVVTLEATPSPSTGRGGGGGGGGPRITVPSAPRNLLAEGGDGQVKLTWEAPEDDGGSAIRDYEYRINGVRGRWISIGSTDTTHTVTGLTNGTVYVFQVRAVNRIGRGRASNRAEATLPVVLDFAHFANGTGITSEMVFVNVSPHPIRPAIYFYDRGGHLIAPDSVVDVTGDLEIQEDGSLSVLTEMEPLGQLTISTHGQGELVSGSVKVLSDGPIGGGVRYGLPEIGVAGVGASPPVRDVLFPARRQEGGMRTATALHNLGEEAVGVRCRLMSGGVALEEAEIPLEANGQASWFIEDVFTTTDTSDFLGSVRCTVLGSRRFTAIAVEMDAAQRIFNTLSVVPVDRTGGGNKQTTLNFAHFVNGTWITDLVFVNLSSEASRPAPTPFHTDILPSRPAIYFYDTEGNPIAAESVVDITGDLEITEDGALTVQTEMEPLGVLTISTHGRGALVSGSARVVSEGPIGGMLRFEHPALGVAGVGASPPVSDVLFPVRRQEGGITTGVALHNLESSPGLLRCDLMREGVLRDAASIPLEANGQTSWLIDQAFPAADTSAFAGSVRCDAVGEGLFSAVALEMDPGNRIFTTLPVVPVPEMTDQE